MTAMTADQCRVLMEGFSALCYRLKAASLTGKGGSVMSDDFILDDKATETETMTNKSVPRSM